MILINKTDRMVIFFGIIVLKREQTGGGTLCIAKIAIFVIGLLIAAVKWENGCAHPVGTI